MPKRNQPGQNFLTSKQTIRRLIRAADLRPSDHVVEIGAGRGHITRELARACGHVSAYEIDRALAGRLYAEFQASNVRVHHRDFLTAALPKDTPYKVFANIPFCRTSEIVRKLTASPAPPEDAWLVMEKGAAKRFMGRPRESRVSLLIKPFFDMEIRYHFRREDFHPAPSVDAVLLHLKQKAVPDIPVSQRRSYEIFTEKHFGGPPRGGPPRGGLPRGGPSRVPGETLYIQWLGLFRRSRGERVPRPRY